MMFRSLSNAVRALSWENFPLATAREARHISWGARNPIHFCWIPVPFSVPNPGCGIKRVKRDEAKQDT